MYLAQVPDKTIKVVPNVWWQYDVTLPHYRQISIISRTLVGNEMVHHPDVVEA